MHKILGCYEPCLCICANLAWQSPPTPSCASNLSRLMFVQPTPPVITLCHAGWSLCRPLQLHTSSANWAIDLPLSSIMCPIITCHKDSHLSSQCSTRMCPNLPPANMRHSRAASKNALVMKINASKVSLSSYKVNVSQVHRNYLSVIWLIIDESCKVVF